MLKILIFNYEFPPLGGGAGNALFYILREFALYSDISIDCVTSSADTYIEEQFAPQIKIYRLDIGKHGRNLHFQTSKDLLTFACKSYFFTKQLLKKKTYDICHAFFGIPCGYIAQRLEIPYLVSLRGSDVPFYNSRFYWFDRMVFRHISRAVWHNARAVIANSEGLRSLATQTCPDLDIGVIPNGVDTQQFQSAWSHSDVVRFLCMSRLIKRKGIEYLIKAYAQLPRGKAVLNIVGEGDQAQYLKGLVLSYGLDKEISFQGKVHHDDVKYVYCEHDVFILPSLNEGMSNTVLEAMACGLPVIVTDTGGTQELVRDNGFVVPKRDSDVLAEKMKRFVDDRGRIHVMGKRSRDISLSMNWERVVKEYYKIYQEN